MISQTGLRVVRSNSCKGPSLSWKKAKKFWGQKCYLGPNFWNLAPKGQTWQPC